jgi:16S rRNA (cytosine967-C5)-methyltransferase
LAAPSLARRLAFDVLLLVERGGYAADLLYRRGGNLLPPDAALSQEIVFGVLRRRPQLDFLLQEHIGKPLSKLDPEVLQAMRMGAYQLHFLDRVPSHAAVSESVALAKYARKVSAMGMVNAILRKVMDMPLPEEWPNRATTLCMPEWILQRWDASYGAEQTAAIAQAFLAKPNVYTRLPSGRTAADYPGFDFQETEIPGCLQVLRGNVQAAGLRQSDIGSQWVATLLDAGEQDRVVDLCAAPGNKTAVLAERASVVAAGDANLQRLLAMRDVGIPRVQLDASAPLPFRSSFSRVLLDAPCSGTGTMGRNPEIRWRLSLEKLREFPRVQRAMLRQALDLVAPNGVLVYATCSLETEENENIVRDVCHDCGVEMFRRIPGECPGDGFFGAVIRKPSSS